MSDPTLADQNIDSELPPPIGDPEKADKYIHTLIDLITQDKLIVAHTDLSKFDPTSLQDHYCLNLTDYEVEVSHNKEPNSGQDSFVILFTNLKHLSDQSSSKVILAFIHLSEVQFKKFKTISDDQIFRKKKETEEKRFKEAMTPIDQILEQLSTNHSEELVDDEVKVEPNGLSVPDSTEDATPPVFAAS